MVVGGRSEFTRAGLALAVVAVLYCFWWIYVMMERCGACVCLPCCLVLIRGVFFERRASVIHTLIYLTLSMVPTYVSTQST